MKRHTASECTLEEYDDWAAASDRFDAVGQAADEEGGPSLSLVPTTERNEVWPTDLLAPAAAESPQDAENPSAPPIPATPFDGIPLEDSRNRLAGWSAVRQRLFLTTLAETGSVHLACAAARLTARSAYRLRARSPAFAAGWDVADQLAVGRLSALAFDRAINGRTEQVWQEGALVAEKRVPSDRLLMWLLARLDPAASPPPGSCARTAPPILRTRRGRASRPCSTRSRIPQHEPPSAGERSRSDREAARRAGECRTACAPAPGRQDRRHGTMVP